MDDYLSFEGSCTGKEPHISGHGKMSMRERELI